MAVDFLPLCDLLFNFISVATYFCDIAFDVIVTYTLYADDHELAWFCVLFFAIVGSVLLCQILSLKWFVEEDHGDTSRLAWTVSVTVHFMLSGVLWRYARLLFVPIDIGLVKREMRNLSILRMIHGFLQCFISLLVQGYLLSTRGDAVTNRSMYYTSCSLSLVNICWAMASFNKNIQRKNIHRLILTWIGVIFQFLWRLGTVGSRCLSLVLYTSVYHGWLFLFGFLHWVCMLVWLLFQRKSYGVKDFSCRFVSKSLLLSLVYMVDFVNMEDASTRVRLVLFYSIVFIENMLLVALWSTHIQTTLVLTAEERTKGFLLTSLPFFLGIVFMLIYYQVFHVTKTSQGGSGNGSTGSTDQSPSSRKMDLGQLSANKTVFNCALNPAMKKRKKIPRVIPPPPPDQKPFWKEPLPDIPNGHLPESPYAGPKGHKSPFDIPGGHESPFQNGNSVDSDLIRQKLEEKRRKEVDQLREIQALNPELRLTDRDLRDLQQQQQHQYSRPRKSGYFPAKSLSHDSSGDQGDIDSTEEFDWSSPTSSSAHINQFSKHPYLPEIVTSNSIWPPPRQQNGSKAETQL